MRPQRIQRGDVDGSDRSCGQRTSGFHCVAAVSSHGLLRPGSGGIDVCPRSTRVAGVTYGRPDSCAFVGPESVHSDLRRVLRALTFWSRVVFIWGTFKVTQARVALLRTRRGDAWVHKVWRAQHENAGDMMWDLCRDLKAFYAKVGQLIAMQAFVPETIRAKLARLQDDMPPLAASVVRRIIQDELHAAKAGTIEEVFKYLDLDSSLGCASIAQVHYGVLRKKNLPVAVKVQQPDAKLLMASDLGNFRMLAEILQKTELKFDLVGPVKELSRQLRSEFDFQNEARSMNTVRDMLLGRVHGVRIPKSVMPLVTSRMLVMEFFEGTPLSRLNGKLRSKHMLRRFGKRAIKRISDAYGEMILMNGFFQADPHPGNIMVLNRQVDIGIIDFGQTKRLSENDRISFAELVDAMARRDAPSVAAAMTSLGIVVEDSCHGRESKRRLRAEVVKGSSTTNASGDKKAMAAVHPLALADPSKLKPRFMSFSNFQPFGTGNGDSDHTDSSTSTAAAPTSNSKLTVAEQLAYTMFDTAEIKGVSSNPFSDESALRTATVKTLPQDLFFLLRTLQIIRGICAATGNEDLSIASMWAPVARRALRSRRLVARCPG